MLVTAHAVENLPPPSQPTHNNNSRGIIIIIIGDMTIVIITKVGEVEVLALQGLDLTVKQGELIGVVGASGSGKSTISKCFDQLDSDLEIEKKYNLPLSQIVSSHCNDTYGTHIIMFLELDG